MKSNRYRNVELESSKYYTNIKFDSIDLTPKLIVDRQIVIDCDTFDDFWHNLFVRKTTSNSI